MNWGLYASYVAGLNKRFDAEIEGCLLHKDLIDRFGAAIAGFGLLPSIYIDGAGELSLTAICRKDSESAIRALSDAGYTVEMMTLGDIQYRREEVWSAPVVGHGLAFTLQYRRFS